MATYKFMYVASAEGDLDNVMGRFFEMFDGEIALQDGRLHIGIYTDTDDPLASVADVVSRLEVALGVTIECTDPDLVDIPEIASRTGRTRQNIQQIATGKRGRHPFPPPLGAPGGKRIWDWATVNHWFKTVMPDLAWDECGLTRDEARLADAWLYRRRTSRPLDALLHRAG